MKVFVLMFGFEYEGYDNEIKVFTSREAAMAEGELVIGSGDFTYDYYDITETNIIG